MKTVSTGFVRELIDFAPTGDAQLSRFAVDQLDGTVALFNMLARNRVAYLADEVGMGKTYVALAVMSVLRHLDPGARVVVIAPRENIQRKWIKERSNFVRHNWKIVGDRVKSIQGAPAWEPVRCGSLLEFAEDALLHADRDFFLRMTSFSLGLHDADRRSDLRGRIRKLVPWADGPPLSARSFEGFRDAFGAAINAAIPEADLVIVDEAHNLKHGFGERVSIRNRLLGLSYGHPAGRAFGGAWYGPRAKRLLLLSATPFEEDYEALQRQLDVFGFGDARLYDAAGRDSRSVRDLCDPDIDEAAKREIVARLMLRRVSGLQIAGALHTKNMYRREWRMGGCSTHDEPMQIDDPKQRLVVALMQKKVAEILQDERFGNSFQIGMLSSFESFLESLSRDQHLAKKLRRSEGDAADADGESSAFDGDQSEREEERRGIDTAAIARVADSYRKRFGASLPHPKLDTTADSLADTFETGEKAMIFVRRIRTVEELAAKLDRHCDAWLRGRMECSLPELRNEITRLFDRYETERARSPEEAILEAQPVDAAEPDAFETLDSRSALGDDDEGGAETFFAWFFRGKGPSGVLSGAAFQKNRLASEGSAYSTLLEDDYVSWLMDRPADPIAALAAELGAPIDTALRTLRESAFGSFKALTKREAGYPRYRLHQAYQSAALALLASGSGALAERARVVLDERFAGTSTEPATPPKGFPGPQGSIGITTIFTEIEKNATLRERLWPDDDAAGDFRARFRRREQRRELLSAMTRLGRAYIDLYLLAIAEIGSFDLRRDVDSGEAAIRLARAYVGLLEKQMGEGGLHAFDELAKASETFDLLVAVNFPELPSAPLHEIAALYGATLQKQVPVGRMWGGVNKRLVRQFRMPGFPLVLVTTDVLQEGEDLHTFCRKVVHYGITWTPSAMEQRTGRVDRIGSLVQRDLDGAAEAPAADRWLQVFYPHLRDTVEVLQVRRVLRRLNRFLLLIHERGEHADFSSRIDAARESLEEIDVVPPLTGPLKSAFPVRPAWLSGAIDAGALAPPVLEPRVRHFRTLWDAVLARHAIHGIHATGDLRREGRASIVGDRLATADAPPDTGRHFTLELRSQAAGDATLLRCRSEVGHLDLANDAILDRLYELQVELRQPRICVEPASTSRDDVVAIQHDIPFSAAATQIEEVVSLVERTVVSAAAISAKLVGWTVPTARRGGRGRSQGR